MGVVPEETGEVSGCVGAESGAAVSGSFCMRSTETSHLLRLAWCAAPLDDRLAAGESASAAGCSSEAQLATWSKVVAGGDRLRFARRLAWDGWSVLEVAERLASAAPPSNWVSPGWLPIFSEALSLAPGVLRRLDRGGRAVAEDQQWNQPVPFVELLVPFLLVARRRLTDKAPGLRGLFSPAAIRDIESKLLKDLSFVSVDALYERFEAWRAARGGALPSRGDQPERRLYLAFVHHLLAGGFGALLADVPVLARLLAIRVDFWVTAMAELTARILGDSVELAEHFGAGGAVVEVGTGLSDRHSGGRQVARLRFENGVDVIYKPRPMALEAAFHNLLRTLAATGLESVPRVLSVIDRGDYGWMELAVPWAAPDSRAASSYFRRAGVLLCLAKILRADDLHAENVVAAESGPVVVDAETFFQPVRADIVNTDLPKVAASQLLTSPQIDALGILSDEGGLCGRGGYVCEARRRIWRFANTDQMSFELAPAVAPERANRLVLDSHVLDPVAFRAELAEGYSTAYCFLTAKRARLLAEGGWLSSFRQAETRILPRPSRTYGVVLWLLSQARNQRSGATAGMLMDALQKDLTVPEERPRLWPLLRQERRALADGDLPVLMIPVLANEISTAEGEPIQGSLLTSGYEAVVREIENLSPAGLEEDLAGLDAALSIAARVAAARAGNRVQPGTTVNDGLSAQLLSAAVTVGRRLVERAETAGMSKGAWLLPEDVPEAPLSLSLYDGAAGIALFLAALAKATGEERFQRLARAALEPVEQKGTSSSFGLIYALAQMGELLGEERWCNLAADLSTDSMRNEDTPLDLVDGMAGLLLGLLALPGRIEQERWIVPARLAARRLVEARDRLDDSGLAHGKAGASLALARWALFLGEHDLAVAEVMRLLDALDHLSSTAVASGPPLSWCRGAAGIGLALSLTSWPSVHDRTRAAVSRAVEWFRGAMPDSIDDACCGQAGRIDFLLTAGEAFQEPAWTGAAHRQAMALAAKAESAGGFALTLGQGAYDPGFFRGLSGIGYTLLRASDPNHFPSVLGLDPGRVSS